MNSVHNRNCALPVVLSSACRCLLTLFVAVLLSGLNAPLAQAQTYPYTLTILTGAPAAQEEVLARINFSNLTPPCSPPIGATTTLVGTQIRIEPISEFFPPGLPPPPRPCSGSILVSLGRFTTGSYDVFFVSNVLIPAGQLVVGPARDLTSVPATGPIALAMLVAGLILIAKRRFNISAVLIAAIGTLLAGGLHAEGVRG